MLALVEDVDAFFEAFSDGAGGGGIGKEGAGEFEGLVAGLGDLLEHAEASGGDEAVGEVFLGIVEGAGDAEGGPEEAALAGGEDIGLGPGDVGEGAGGEAEAEEAGKGAAADFQGALEADEAVAGEGEIGEGEGSIFPAPGGACFAEGEDAEAAGIRVGGEDVEEGEGGEGGVAEGEGAGDERVAGAVVEGEVGGGEAGEALGPVGTQEVLALDAGGVALGGVLVGGEVILAAGLEAGAGPGAEGGLGEEELPVLVAELGAVDPELGEEMERQGDFPALDPGAVGIPRAGLLGGEGDTGGGGAALGEEGLGGNFPDVDALELGLAGEPGRAGGLADGGAVGRRGSEDFRPGPGIKSEVKAAERGAADFPNAAPDATEADLGVEAIRPEGGDEGGAGGVEGRGIDGEAVPVEGGEGTVHAGHLAGFSGKEFPEGVAVEVAAEGGVAGGKGDDGEGEKGDGGLPDPAALAGGLASAGSAAHGEMLGPARRAASARMAKCGDSGGFPQAEELLPDRDDGGGVEDGRGGGDEQSATSGGRQAAEAVSGNPRKRNEPQMNADEH